MKTKHLIYAVFALLALVSGGIARAEATEPELKLLGIDVSSDGTGQIRGKLDAAGKTLAHVRAITYSTLDGSQETLADSYKIYDGQYIVADLIGRTSSYAYRLEVEFEDGSTVRTECVDANNSEPFMWLTDFPISSYSLPNAGEEPGVDKCLSDTLLCLTGQPYYKGVSSRGGTITYEFPAEYNFRRITSRLALQHNNNGSLQFRAYFNTATSYMGFTVSANNKYDFDSNTNNWISNATYFPNLPITKLTLDFRANSTKIANWLIPRLYITREASIKEVPELTLSPSSRQIAYPQTVQLLATSNSGCPIYYEVVRGAEAVTLEGTSLTFKDGHNTTVEVKAIQFGDDDWEYADASAIFDVQTGGKVFFTSALPAREEEPQLGFLSLNRRGRELTELKVQVFDNYKLLQPVTELDLLPLWQEMTASCTTSDHEHNVPFDFSEMTGDRIFRVVYRFEEDDVCYGPYRNGTTESFQYMSELPYLIQGGYNGMTYIDKAFGGAAMKLGGQQYNKGFGFHAEGWVSTNCSLSNFDRFSAVVGKNDGRSGNLGFTLSTDNATLCERTIVTSGNLLDWNYAIPAGTKSIKINADLGGDGNGQDHVTIAVPRLFYKISERRPQTLEWAEKHEIIEPGECTISLADAAATSGLPVYFRIIKGAEYAEIVNENQLHLSSVPEEGEIIVEAFQPGDREWDASLPVLSTFRVARGVLVRKDQRINLEGGSTLEELVIYSDGVNCGQADVPSGVVNVKRLKLRMSFVPGLWQSICFPTSIDIERSSNLTDLGYALDTNYELKCHDGEYGSLNPEQEPWRSMASTKIDAMKGYLMKLNGDPSDSPVEVEFVIENVQLDFESRIRMLNLTVDLSDQYADTQHNIYLKPANVKGNTLKVIVDYQPSDPSSTPVNHEQALQDMRITFAPGNAGIRLVLPDASPAKVAIFDASGRKLVKAVNYVSPQLIEMRDVAPGDYNLVVQYGPATTVRSFSFKK